MSQPEVQMGPNFIRNIIDEDLASGKHQTVITRFPPEPNGYLHIGHAKSICLNFGLAGHYRGRCHLRFDDTNPVKEEQEYIDAIKQDVRWLGFDWGEHEYYASDYFERLHEFAVRLIRDGKAYVDSLSAEEIREYRGTVTEAGLSDVDRVVRIVTERKLPAMFVESSVPRRSIEAVREACRARGHDVRIGGQLVSCKAAKTYRAEIDDTISIHIPKEICHLFDGKTGARIGG